MSEDIDLTDFNASTACSRSSTLRPEPEIRHDSHTDAEQVFNDPEDNDNQSNQDTPQVERNDHDSIPTALCSPWLIFGFCNRKFIGAATLLTLVVTCFTLWPNMQAELDSRSSLALAKWTAIKDFLAWCNTQDNGTWSEDCVFATKVGLPAPPNFDRKGPQNLPRGPLKRETDAEDAGKRFILQQQSENIWKQFIQDLDIEDIRMQSDWLGYIRPPFLDMSGAGVIANHRASRSLHAFFLVSCLSICICALYYIRRLRRSLRTWQGGPLLMELYIKDIERQHYAACGIPRTMTSQCDVGSQLRRRRKMSSVQNTSNNSWSKAVSPMWPEILRQSGTEITPTDRPMMTSPMTLLWSPGVDITVISNDSKRLLGPDASIRLGIKGGEHIVCDTTLLVKIAQKLIVKKGQSGYWIDSQHEPSPAMVDRLKEDNARFEALRQLEYRPSETSIEVTVLPIASSELIDDEIVQRVPTSQERIDLESYHHIISGSAPRFARKNLNGQQPLQSKKAIEVLRQRAKEAAIERAKLHQQNDDSGKSSGADTAAQPRLRRRLATIFTG